MASTLNEVNQRHGGRRRIQMTEQPVIMIQVARRGWTINALHAACQMAKKVKGRIALVKMVPVQHFAWLGTELGYMDLTYEEEEEIKDYQELIEEYNVEFDICLFQYTSMVNAIVQAVEHAQAQVL